MKLDIDKYQSLANDFTNFSRVLLTLAAFLSVGFYLPDTFSASQSQVILIIVSFLLIGSICFHAASKKAEKHDGEQQ
ncbi:YrhC-like protein [Alteribacillus persepolensis]|uniref:YrhC-like protein n=1 Tax=Alteribacillus persepolensis TaxID=568899 RepID=A0A1G8DLU2_9BACI|nr:YrhC family protein [Alteribacillus persepolensis]SDH58439.1 YrhC-like protein [Alteribacillus persepolensis]